MISEEFVDALIECVKLKKRALDRYEELLPQSSTEDVIEKIIRNEQSHMGSLCSLVHQVLNELDSMADAGDDSGKESGKDNKNKKKIIQKMKKLKEKLEKAWEELGVDCSGFEDKDF